MGENKVVEISSRDAHESARASLEVLCSSLKRQHFIKDNNSQSSSCDKKPDAPDTVTAVTEEGTVTFTVGGGITIEHINTLRELQEMLRIKDEKVAELKALLVQRDAEIQKLRKKLDMYRNILPLCSPNGIITKHRPQGDH